ncbi:SGNH/GDSL hydrolase family protein [Skermania sp. ID1734]|uniref:SGNH/GDSL hydrolase family protein n=1 Tax=Skermania sp. ID1734 TaxID=2597516 RepID=UPI00117DED90|nr:SGNH/GDSL hydrolase family protein [Skermania sp. ID1734]TSD99449.1 SGNH/GDSL hydrolase family protein [Skermania sp. ID1734]
MGFDRFVALGDSQTEGLWDGDDETGLAGWADRLAQRLALDNPDIRYANLAMRAQRICDVYDRQFRPALAMAPDLVGICVGMNDVLGLRGELAGPLDLMELTYRRFAQTGAVVLTTTFPDLRPIFPASRLMYARIERVNERIRLCARRYDLALVDLYAAPSMVDLRMWSPDRVHGSSLGHEMFARAAAEALGLDGADHSWAQPLASVPTPMPAAVVGVLRREASWAASELRPWVVRRLRGKSTGDGRVARRPELAPVVLDSTSSQYQR